MALVFQSNKSLRTQASEKSDRKTTNTIKPIKTIDPLKSMIYSSSHDPGY